MSVGISTRCALSDSQLYLQQFLTGWDNCHIPTLPGSHSPTTSQRRNGKHNIFEEYTREEVIELFLRHGREMARRQRHQSFPIPREKFPLGTFSWEQFPLVESDSQRKFPELDDTGSRYITETSLQSNTGSSRQLTKGQSLCSLNETFALGLINEENVFPEFLQDIHFCTDMRTDSLNSATKEQTEKQSERVFSLNTIWSDLDTCKQCSAEGNPWQQDSSMTTDCDNHFISRDSSDNSDNSNFAPSQSCSTSLRRTKRVYTDIANLHNNY